MSTLFKRKKHVNLTSFKLKQDLEVATKLGVIIRSTETSGPKKRGKVIKDIEPKDFLLIQIFHFTRLSYYFS